MARLQRVVLPGYPLHIMVRGHNSKDIFISDEEKKSYLEWLKDAAREYELAIHAFGLMCIFWPHLKPSQAPLK